MHSDLAISQADPRPMYLQIKEQIRHRIAIGDWKPGQEIPSIRMLAIGMRVSVITIKRTYLELEREGVIVTRQGKGSFVTDQANLGQDLQGEELDSHLNAAAQIANLMGLSSDELSARLRKAERHTKRKP